MIEQVSEYQEYSGFITRTDAKLEERFIKNNARAILVTLGNSSLFMSTDS
jgi:hypothetical protein